MSTRAFPVVYATDVGTGYVGPRRGDSELAVVACEWSAQQYGLGLGNGPRFEMFVYVDDVDKLVPDLRAAGVTVLRAAADMPWGERSHKGETHDAYRRSSR